MGTTTLDSLASLLAARPAVARARKQNGADIMRRNRINEARDGNVVNITPDEFYSRGDSKGQPMTADDVRNTYNRKYGDELKEYALVVHVITWDADGNMLPEGDAYALLAPVTA